MVIGFRCYNKKLSKITSGTDMSNRSNSRTDSRIDELLYNANDLDNLGSSEDTE
tara:strand:- start:123 stop:284 length:162 start_codon:yes stop_codon:yes gene_type:complete